MVKGFLSPFIQCCYFPFNPSYSILFKWGILLKIFVTEFHGDCEGGYNLICVSLNLHVAIEFGLEDRFAKPWAIDLGRDPQLTGPIFIQRESRGYSYSFILFLPGILDVTEYLEDFLMLWGIFRPLWGI